MTKGRPVRRETPCRTIEYVTVGAVRFERHVSVFIHDETPLREYGFLNGRCSDIADIAVDQPTVTIRATRSTQPTAMSLWVGERCVSLGDIDIAPVERGDWMTFREGSISFRYRMTF